MPKIRSVNFRALLYSRLPLWVAVALFSLQGVRADSYTYPQLVARLTNLQRLAELPPPGETVSLASGYNRSSRYDEVHDQYMNWEAKNDGTGVVRQEGDESVLADLQGPGCIWRLSAASAGPGHVKIYLDNSAEPAVDLPLADYFSGQVEPFNRPNLVYDLRKEVDPTLGFDNYTPISFQKFCKIVADKNWGKAYQVTYTQFPTGTVVPTFQMKLPLEDAAALNHANEILGQCGQPPTAQPDERTDGIAVHTGAGQTSQVAELSGAGAITALRVKLDLPKDPEAQRTLLGQLTMTITWDDEPTPAVWSPLGDFFGYVGGAIPFKSLPVGLLEDGTFYSHWYMPYGTKARLVVGNDAPRAVDMTWQITHTVLTQPIASQARFHAKWYRDAFLLDRPDRQPDWTLLTTHGRGRYVGTHLHGWNALASLWGEGGERFFVDGEKFPSSFGTSMENYFGYARRSAALFSKPYHDQIQNENNENHFNDNRWHVSDAVPFQSSFDSYLSKASPNLRYTHYAAEAFWYLAAGGTDAYAAVPVADRVGWWDTPPIFRELGVIEGESLLALNPSASRLSVVNTRGSGDLYSGGHELQWNPKEEEKTLSLKFPVAVSGKYRLIVRYDIRHDHGQGIVQLSVDGKPIGSPLVLFGPASVLSPATELGAIELTTGLHDLGVEFLQKNDPGKGAYLGLDYIKLVPAP